MGAQEEDAAATRTLDDLIEKFDTAMLVTRSLNGDLRARPMMIAEHERVATLYFASRAEDPKLDEIVEDSSVAVTMQDAGRYLSISGRARVDTDQSRIDAAWSLSWRVWFPDGSHDPQLRLIAVEPDRAEYWDRKGLNRLEFFWEAGKAILHGTKASDERLRGHEKVDLPS